jgi:hypothetical protein
MGFGLPDPDEALREAEQRDLEAERKAERKAEESEERAQANERPEPGANDDEHEADKP